MAADLHLAPVPSEPGGDGHASPRVRVILAEDHVLMRHSLRMLFEGEDDVELIAEASDLRVAVRRVRQYRPDVLVLDLRMPGGSSIEAIRELREQAPDTRVVVVTMEDNPLFATRALDAGALGFVVKDYADDELPSAVRAAACGERFLSPRLAPRVQALDAALTDQDLTPREVEILRLIALGHTSVEVARMLHLSSRTVESHRARILNKLGLGTRAELVRYALGRGLLSV